MATLNTDFHLVDIKNISNPSNLNEKNTKNKNKNFFEVFHKKEIVYINNNSMDKSKNSQIIQYKCFYCKNNYNSLNSFESHMKQHVRKINI